METLEELVMSQVACELRGSEDNSQVACEAHLNSMTNHEFLQRLSWALDKLQPSKS